LLPLDPDVSEPLEPDEPLDPDDPLDPEDPLDPDDPLESELLITSIRRAWLEPPFAS
jgi:hypothetical protein